MAELKKLPPRVTRFTFLRNGMRALVGTVLGVSGGWSAFGARRKNTVWQIDPMKCVQCEHCSTSCVVAPSAVKCVQSYSICGYCQLCFGYFQPNAPELTAAAENQLCPTDAITHSQMDMEHFLAIPRELNVGKKEGFDLVRARRSQRNFKDKKIPQQDMEELVELCRYIPTGSNRQTLEIVVDKKTRLPRAFTVGGDQPIMQMNFTNYEKLKQIDPALFEYTPPEGAQVMDLSTMPGAQ